ncbi:MAG: PAS domain-containing protein [Chloroflexi bacterium]|nr:PAS domain-containing protein [Chloroflexota bacterium]
MTGSQSGFKIIGMTETNANSFSQNIYDFVLHRAAEALIQTDAADSIVLFNPAAAAMLQLSSAEVLGQISKDAFTGNLNLIRLLKPAGPDLLDIKLPRDRLAQGIAQDLPEGGRIVLLHDVTERRQLESRREALIKAISHDLRNPISALNGYADLISKQGTLNEKQTLFLTRIQQTSTKLWELTASLVDLAWIEAGMPLEYQPIDLPKLIHQTVDALRSEARRKQIAIVISTQDPMPLIMGDPARLKQAIHHLLENAILYSHSGSNVGIHAWQQQDRVFGAVIDRGFGISADDLIQIWDRMWRSPDDRVRAISGGGIGLTYVRTIIQRHGGNISVESKLNEGSTFTFVLPLADER